MTDLTTTYMGMTLKNPVVASASPISETVEGICRLEDAGASAVVMYSLFEEQINYQSQLLDHYLSYNIESFAEALDYYPDLENYKVGPESYLEILRRAKEVTEIPIIGSLNGVSSGGWIEYAKKIEEAGADALELNTYFIPTDIGMSGTDVEQMYLDVLRDVKSSISIPVAMKLNPYFSATANMAFRLAEAGADALVMFNRFYQPDFDIENLEVVPHLVLSNSNEMRLPLRWVAILYGRVPVDFAITTGVHNHEDVLKGMMAGAKVTMMASELLHHGLDRIDEILQEMTIWMEEREYTSVVEMQGSMSQQYVAEPSVFERANYMKILQSWQSDPTGRMAHLSI
ncbi:MAG TPA: dihydroorotate dehydrogenase-like protein [Anaerolineae bacterium]|nr:dihydroorotate dehydrogenase-like protein [Anaerolineae bacterium]MCB0180745.1 dihydroorotate dehydrogenase-like protein [Anaerolineae bacterium]MCB9104240.1 dihydroorotate dehydrogenase-like protein [Anaerolineales bacterium]HRV90813.1 dihydroorotate dehydrogenase-like protein [Anaerolineae bacterium]